MKALTALVFAALLLAGCKEQPPINEQSAEITKVGTLNYVYRHIDSEAGVVCWVYNSYQKGGIDCLPISDTRLEE